MMKLDSFTQTITFALDIHSVPGFMVDIVETPTEYEAWLYHKDYGIKELMFGTNKTQHKDRADFCEMVENNLVNQGYIGGYINEHMIE